MAKLCRFHIPQHGARLGMLIGDEVYDLTSSGIPQLTTFSRLLRATTSERVDDLLRSVDLDALPSFAYQDLDQPPTGAEPHLLPPVDRQEVGAAGVTYAWSREARVREAQSKEIYVRVYEAERPELFFKSLPEKTIGPNDWIGVRDDSRWNVPEPELALLLNPDMEIVGYTVGNDVSSRDIEGENPLYLPQAKVYKHSCAVGPVIRLADGSIDGQNLTIHLAIKREGRTIFEEETTTALMHRGLPELASYLGRCNEFPSGAALLTGTCIVPDDEFSLMEGDLVTVTIEGIGALRNPVKTVTAGT